MQIGVQLRGVLVQNLIKYLIIIKKRERERKIRKQEIKFISFVTTFSIVVASDQNRKKKREKNLRFQSFFKRLFFNFTILNYLN